MRCTHPSGSSQPTSPVRYQPSCEGVGVRLVGEVAGHHRRAAGLDLADRARRERLARVEVDHAELHLRRGQAGRVEPPRGRDRRPGCRRAPGSSLRAVGGQEADAGAPRDGLGHALGDRRGAPHDVAERREVVAPRARGGWPWRARSAPRPSRGSCARPRCGGAPRRGRSARCSRTVAPASAAAERLSRPEDVRGRRGHLEAVVGAEARGLRTSAAVAAPIDRVGVAHGLRQPGRAGAEHEDGLVARAARPASAAEPDRGRARLRSVAASSRSVTRSAPRLLPEHATRPGRRRPRGRRR